MLLWWECHIVVLSYFFSINTIFLIIPLFIYFPLKPFQRTLEDVILQLFLFLFLHFILFHILSFFWSHFLVHDSSIGILQIIFEINIRLAWNSNRSRWLRVYATLSRRINVWTLQECNLRVASAVMRRIFRKYSESVFHRINAIWVFRGSWWFWTQ